MARVCLVLSAWYLVPTVCNYKYELVIGIMTRLRAGRYGVQILVGTKIFFSSVKRPDYLWGPHSLLLNCYRSYFPGREFGNSLWSSAEVKNGWSCASVPPICLYGVDFTFVTFTCSGQVQNIGSHLGLAMEDKFAYVRLTGQSVSSAVSRINCFFFLCRQTLVLWRTGRR
jgi:hypothetical protein